MRVVARLRNKLISPLAAVTSNSNPVVPPLFVIHRSCQVSRICWMFRRLCRCDGWTENQNRCVTRRWWIPSLASWRTTLLTCSALLSPRSCLLSPTTFAVPCQWSALQCQLAFSDDHLDLIFSPFFIVSHQRTGRTLAFSSCLPFTCSLSYSPEHINRATLIVSFLFISREYRMSPWHSTTCLLTERRTVIAHSNSDPCRTL